MQQEQLNQKRRNAVKLRLEGKKLTEITAETGLSAPTIITAHKNFKNGGWDAVDSQPRGRARGQKQSLSGDQLTVLCNLALSPPAAEDTALWTVASFMQHLNNGPSYQISARTLNRYLTELGLHNGSQLKLAQQNDDFAEWFEQVYPQIVAESSATGSTLLWTNYINLVEHEKALIFTHTPRGKYCWMAGHQTDSMQHLLEFSKRAVRATKGPVCLILSGIDVFSRPAIRDQLDGDSNIKIHPGPAFDSKSNIKPHSAEQINSDAKAADISHEIPDRKGQQDALPPITPRASTTRSKKRAPRTKPTMSLTHLERLEAESIHIMREVIADADKPVMLYSIGKDSAVMLHLAMKAFYPAKPPFPLLHVDTGWKFQAMYTFRDKMVKDLGLQLITHTNAEGVEKGVNPFTHGSALHTDIMKTEALRQALDKYGFDAAFGGARRDEEKSRAKERIFSFRNEQHRWDPKNQRPELWNLYNARKNKGESVRVFPLSNWTELDIWQYIHLENIPIVPLYLSAERPVVERDASLIMVDDDRMPMNPGEVPMMKRVRFRTLGCYPLTGAIESEASTLPDIIQEMLLASTSERQGRMIDHDSNASMEKKKQEGYF